VVLRPLKNRIGLFIPLHHLYRFRYQAKCVQGEIQPLRHHINGRIGFFLVMKVIFITGKDTADRSVSKNAVFYRLVELLKAEIEDK
jgi:hypothetical protein